MYVLNGDEVTTVVTSANWKAVTSKQVEMDDCTKNYYYYYYYYYYYCVTTVSVCTE